MTGMTSRIIHSGRLPESFNVMVKELQSLGLDVELVEDQSLKEGQ